MQIFKAIMNNRQNLLIVHGITISLTLKIVQADYKQKRCQVYFMSNGSQKCSPVVTFRYTGEAGLYVICGKKIDKKEKSNCYRNKRSTS